MLLSLIAMLALTQAEIDQRMLAPIVTQADGLVRVFANCPEDMRREYQMPIARFAADTVTLLYRGAKLKPERFDRPRIIVHVGDVRTNLTDVIVRVRTNENVAVTRIFLRSPGSADLDRYRMELVRAFYRGVCKREVTDAQARAILHAADPSYRISDQRAQLEAWLAGDRSKQGNADDEAWDDEHLKLFRKVIEVGVDSRRDVLTFASRLYLYPPHFNEPFAGGRSMLSFREAIALVDDDLRIRIVALQKTVALSLFGSGRSDALRSAAEAYVDFLKELARGEKDRRELEDMLSNADKRLEMVWARTMR